MEGALQPWEAFGSPLGVLLLLGPPCMEPPSGFPDGYGFRSFLGWLLWCVVLLCLACCYCCFVACCSACVWHVCVCGFAAILIALCCLLLPVVVLPLLC